MSADDGIFAFLRELRIPKFLLNPSSPFESILAGFLPTPQMPLLDVPPGLRTIAFDGLKLDQCEAPLTRNNPVSIHLIVDMSPALYSLAFYTELCRMERWLFGKLTRGDFRSLATSAGGGEKQTPDAATKSSASTWRRSDERRVSLRKHYSDRLSLLVLLLVLIVQLDWFLGVSSRFRPIATSTTGFTRNTITS